MLKYSIVSKIKYLPIIPLLIFILSAGFLLFPTQSSGFWGWQAYESDNFVLFFPAGYENQARETLHQLESHRPWINEFTGNDMNGREDKIHLSLEDIGLLANGYANPVFGKMGIFTGKPGSYSGLAGYENWLRLVNIHELIHMHHMTATSGISSTASRLFGSIMSPNIHSPLWLIEGLAVYGESRISPFEGRLNTGRYDGVLAKKAWAEQLPSLPEITYRHNYFPAGQQYLYGAAFVRYLAEKYGQEKLTELITTYGSYYWAPFIGNLFPALGLDRAVSQVFSQNLTSLYQEWQQHEMKKHQSRERRELEEKKLPAGEKLLEAKNSYLSNPSVNPDSTAENAGKIYFFSSRNYSSYPFAYHSKRQLISYDTASGKQEILLETIGSNFGTLQVTGDSVYYLLGESIGGYPNVYSAGTGVSGSLFRYDLKSGRSEHLLQTEMTDFAVRYNADYSPIKPARNLKDNFTADSNERIREKNREIIFTRASRNGYGSEIYRYSYNQGNKQKLGTLPEYISEIKPYQNDLLVVSKPPDGTWNINRLKINGSDSGSYFGSYSGSDSGSDSSSVSSSNSGSDSGSESRSESSSESVSKSSSESVSKSSSESVSKSSSEFVSKSGFESGSDNDKTSFAIPVKEGEQTSEQITLKLKPLIASAWPEKRISLIENKTGASTPGSPESPGGPGRPDSHSPNSLYYTSSYEGYKAIYRFDFSTGKITRQTAGGYAKSAVAVEDKLYYTSYSADSMALYQTTAKESPNPLSLPEHKQKLQPGLYRSENGSENVSSINSRKENINSSTTESLKDSIDSIKFNTKDSIKSSTNNNIKENTEDSTKNSIENNIKNSIENNTENRINKSNPEKPLKVAGDDAAFDGNIPAAAGNSTARDYSANHDIAAKVNYEIREKESFKKNLSYLFPPAVRFPPFALMGQDGLAMNSYLIHLNLQGGFNLQLTSRLFQPLNITLITSFDPGDLVPFNFGPKTSNTSSATRLKLNYPLYRSRLDGLTNVSLDLETDFRSIKLGSRLNFRYPDHRFSLHLEANPLTRDFLTRLNYHYLQQEGRLAFQAGYYDGLKPAQDIREFPQKGSQGHKLALSQTQKLLEIRKGRWNLNLFAGDLFGKIFLDYLNLDQERLGFGAELLLEAGAASWLQFVPRLGFAISDQERKTYLGVEFSF